MTTRTETPGASTSVPAPRSADSPGEQPTATSPAGDVLLAHLREQVQQVHVYDQPVRRDASDAVHKMRVAVRRLRSALTTFAPLVPGDVRRPLGKELKWLAGVLGDARDAEVLRDRVRASLEGEGADAATAVVDAELAQAYRDAHDRVLAALDGERYAALMATLDRLVAAPALKERAAAAAGATLPPLVAGSFAELRSIVAAADAMEAGDEREELLHDARKAAKRSRYAAESVRGVFGSDAVAFANAMEAVQETLGEHQDSVLTRARLRELARHSPSTDAAFLYGRLYALEEARAGQSRRDVDAAWKAAAAKPLHRWLR